MPNEWNTSSLIALAVAAGTAVGGIGTWLIQLVKVQQDGKKDATTVALQALVAALEGQRNEISRLTVEASSARHEAADCDKKYRALRLEMDGLRKAMQKAGLAVPEPLET